MNPIAGSSRFTSRSAADRYVRQGRAVMEGGWLRFLEGSERNVVTRVLASRPDLVTGFGMARLDQVRKLPCAGPAIKVFTILSKRGPGYRPVLA